MEDTDFRSSHRKFKGSFEKLRDNTLIKNIIAAEDGLNLKIANIVG